MGQSNGKTFIIEFNGTPGAGKTTVARAVKRRLRDMKVKEISSSRVLKYRGGCKEIMGSKEARYVYMLVLKAFLLIRPVTRERLKYMKTVYNYWLGIKKLCTSKNQSNRVCILDQGIIQGFVSMAYLGEIRNKKEYYECIRRVMDTFDNVICVNCTVNVDRSMMRMFTRTPNGGRLYQIDDAKELKKVLEFQKKQFEEIRQTAIEQAITIDMNDPAENNAEQIIEYCKEHF